MTDSGEETIGWDETVDLICVGSSPGVLAYAICCALNDLDVLCVQAPDEPDEQMAAWFAEMTMDLAPGHSPGREIAPEDRPGFSLAGVVPPPAPAGKRVILEPFIGEHLRQWSAHCLASPLGVMFTEVPELLLPMCTDGGATITAAVIGEFDEGDLVAWLLDRARANGFDDPKNIMATTVVEDRRIAGVELDDGYLVAARRGLVWPVGAGAAIPDLPDRDRLTVAMVGRPAGRFAAVDLLATVDLSAALDLSVKADLPAQ